MQRALQRVPLRAYLNILFLFCCALFWAGCDSEPGPEDPLGRPPVVSDLAFTPEALDIKSLDAGAVVDGDVDVQVDVSVQAVDDGALDRVVFIIRPPDQDLAPVAFHFLESGPDNTYSGSFTVTFDTGIIGRYVVEAYAVDDDNLLSNTVLGALDIIRDGQPPIIDEVIAPDSIQRPDEGTAELQIVAVVSDPDGVSNVSNVLFWNVNSPNNTFSLFDDGIQGGDEIAGDGRFTLTIVISSTNALGTNTFAFQATDRSGLQSDIVTKDITVE